MQRLHFVPIPTNQSFLSQWHAWIQGKVSKHYKRDKSRMGDTAQNVRLRLLTKDFIGRWFFKHLTDELVELSEAEAMLGGMPILYIGALKPAYVFQKEDCVVADTKAVDEDRRRREWLEKREDKKIRLYRVSDILKFARFDYERYYYSIQNHTIDSDKVLRFLGYKPGQYTALSSLWRSRGFRPSELTEHPCNGDPCEECDKGRTSLRSRGLSLAHDWSKPEVAAAAAKLRWNDSQLKPFLREWRKANTIKRTPICIVRLAPSQGIDAGLLKYAQIIVDNEVSNDFKRMSRADDLETFVRAGGVCPEHSNDESMGWESDNRPSGGEERPTRAFRDMNGAQRVKEYEVARDLRRVMAGSGLTDEEADVIQKLELDEMSVRTYCDATGMPAARVNRLRSAALAKLKTPFAGRDSFLQGLATRFGCSVDEILDPTVAVGRAIPARTEMFYGLSRLGMTAETMASAFGFPIDRVQLSISRHPDLRAIDPEQDEMVE